MEICKGHYSMKQEGKRETETLTCVY